MDDLISRSWLLSEYDKRHKGPPGGARKLIEEAPSSAEKESFEWCTDCKEYDQEGHCCHRFSKMIRKTIEEMQIVHCIDCQYSEYDSVYGDRYCHYNGKAEVVDDYHFCRDGERREVTT